jgi:hypothetical protein
MLLTLDLLRCAVGIACVAYRRFVPATRDFDMSRIEWCCGCVSVAQPDTAGERWIDETRCKQHAGVPNDVSC